MSKRTMRWLCLGAVLLAALAGLAVLGIYQLRFRVEKDPLAHYQVLDAEQTRFAWELESCQVENGELVVSGWLVEPGKEYRGLNGGTGEDNIGVYNCVWVVLLDEATGTVYRLPTQARLPGNGDPYPEDGIDHKNCAFESRTSADRWTGLEDGRLCLAVMTYEGDRYLIPTERRWPE